MFDTILYAKVTLDLAVLSFSFVCIAWGLLMLTAIPVNIRNWFRS